MRWMPLLTMLAVLIATGCGSQAGRHSSTAPIMTPAAFRARVNGICRAFHVKAASLGTPQTLSQAVEWIDRARPLDIAEGVRLGAVSPPEAEAVAYQRLIGSIGPTMQLAGRLRQAAAVRDMRRFRVLAALSVRRQRSYDAIARSIGLNDCVGLR
jgi:hypothetical protein